MRLQTLHSLVPYRVTTPLPQTSPQEWAREVAEVMRMQKTVSTAADGAFQCDHFFR